MSRSSDDSVPASGAHTKIESLHVRQRFVFVQLEDCARCARVIIESGAGSLAGTGSSLVMPRTGHWSGGPPVLTCWVEPRVKPGDRITLTNSIEPQRLWEVLRVGDVRSSGDIKRGWSNNI